MPDARKKLVLIDGNSLLYRGFFAMRALTTSAGQPTNAVFSFTMMLLTLLQDQKPDVLLCAWDMGKTFRHDEYTEYKGTRQTTPPELTEQAPLARELVEAFRIPSITAPGFEADDIIGTMAARGNAAGYEVLIVTGDLDALQLVEPNVRVMTTVKGVSDTIIYDEAAVFNRYSLHPNQLADYRALKGDTSDNIPGVPGIGEKAASTLLQQYGTAENVFEHAAELKPPRVQAAISANGDKLTLSKRLAIIIRDVPLPGVDLPALDAEPVAPDWTKVKDLFERLEFRALLKRIPSATTATSPASAGTLDLESSAHDPFAETASYAEETPAKPPRVEVSTADWHEVDVEDAKSVRALTDAVKAAHCVGVRLDVTEGGILDAVIRGVALAAGDGAVFYVPFSGAAPAPPPKAEGQPATQASLFDEPAEQIPAETADVRWGGGVGAALVKPLLEDASVLKVTHDVKTDTGILLRYGIALRGVVYDTEFGAYLLNAGRRGSFPLNEVASDYAGRELHPLDKKERKGMEEDAIAAHERSESYAAADAILAIKKVQEPRIAADGLDSVLKTFELPVAPILAEMEAAGVLVDVPILNRLSAEMQTKIDALERDIFEIAGVTFVIASPKQLQEVLFEKLGLPSGKKTKTGYSTNADVLEELAPEYPIVAKVLQHRGLAKLKGTYADAMPALVRPATGRIHTTMNQASVATGRISSSNPNLQNIPIRTESGREIRRAFVAPPGKLLISADYSQIELRIFAHVTGDDALVAAFSSGEDIHKYTAGKVYGVPPAEVTSDMRRAAKTINYAVLYGISDFALGRQIGIPMKAAKELKESYFARFPGVKKYIDDTVAFARETGYVKTMFGRRRYIPDINSRVFHFRQASERMAANMPMQGAGADIMKLAMIAVKQMLDREKFSARMLLQVHDELLFEASPDEMSALAPHIRAAMTGVCKLVAPLEVEVKTGSSWADVTPVPDVPDDLLTEVL